MPILVEQLPKTETNSREIQAYNDATTMLAEAIDGRMRTSFDYCFSGKDLLASGGEPLGPLFEKSLAEADEIKVANPTLAFESRRRREELDEYHEMVGIAKGELPNTMVVISDFPIELMNSDRSVGGYNVDRKQAMLRVITKRVDGSLRMQSQSLDGSNRTALEAIYTGFGERTNDSELLGQRIHAELDETEQEFLIDRLMGVYDRSLEAQNPGQYFRAGRLIANRYDLETHDFVCQQVDLISYLTSKMISSEATENDIFSVIATMAQRYEKATTANTNEASLGRVALSTPAYRTLQQEMLEATSLATVTGKTFNFCGGSLGANGQSGIAEELSASGYGNKSNEDKYGSLDFDCPHCHKTNHRERNKLIPNCKHCGADVHC